MVGFFFFAGVKHFLLPQPFKKRYILINSSERYVLNARSFS